MSDLISRADAIDAVMKHKMPFTIQQEVAREIDALPSADAESDDLIIKGAKGIQDGLYNIKDGKLFKYKGKGGTVRTYPIVPSADAVDCTDFIEWLVDRVLDETIWEYNSVAYGEIICRKLEKLGVLEVTEEPSYYIRPSADAVQGEWKQTITWQPYCSNCEYVFGEDEEFSPFWKYCPMCGAIMKGGAK